MLPTRCIASALRRTIALLPLALGLAAAQASAQPSKPAQAGRDDNRWCFVEAGPGRFAPEAEDLGMAGCRRGDILLVSFLNQLPASPSVLIARACDLGKPVLVLPQPAAEHERAERVICTYAGRTRDLRAGRRH